MSPWMGSPPRQPGVSGESRGASPPALRANAENHGAERRATSRTAQNSPLTPTCLFVLPTQRGMAQASTSPHAISFGTGFVAHRDDLHLAHAPGGLEPRDVALPFPVQGARER